VFNVESGVFRCPNSQQGYAPSSTWTRGLAWAVCGFAEELEFINSLPPDGFNNACSRNPTWSDRLIERHLDKPQDERRREVADMIRQKLAERGVATVSLLLKAATATADFYLANSCADGIPMWDTGAPHLHRLPANYLSKPADPFNAHEPVDSSAAAIAAQGLIRLGNYLIAKGDKKNGARYRQAGLTVADTLFSEPYLSTNPKHQGLILHSVYHRPNGWDYIAPGQKVPNGESSMWGDYHALELALLLQREAKGEPYLTFFGCVPK
jgi:hypothetical protein